MAKKVGRGILYAVLFCILLRACGIITLTEHEHEWQDATCTEPRTCATCDEQEGEPLGHTWIPATCTEAEHCSVCGQNRHWYSEPAGHDWEMPTCTTPKTCSRCGETTGEAYGHNFAAYQWETTVEPTCQTEGEATHTCTRCGEAETKALPAIDHKADGWTIIQEATATTRGIRVKLCTMCGTEIDREEYQYIQTSASTGNSTGGGGGGNNFNTYDNEEQQNTTAKYVLNTSTRVFHRPSCRDVPKISPDNYSATSRTREDLTASGWRSCGHCSP